MKNVKKMRWNWINYEKNKNIKEIIFYAFLIVILVAISILNNTFWKLGKEENVQVQENKSYNEQQLLEVNNITYNVPYEERWLD